MAQLSDRQKEILIKYKQDLRKGRLDRLIKELLTISYIDRAYIITYMVEHGVDILSQMEYLPTGSFTEYNSTILTIPGNIKKIRDSAIVDNNFKEIIIDDGVEVIGKEAIRSNRNLERIILPNTLTSIGSNAFADNPSLKEVFIPDSIKVLPKNLFKHSDNVIVTANYRENKADRLKCVESEIPWYKEHLKWIRND